MVLPLEEYFSMKSQPISYINRISRWTHMTGTPSTNVLYIDEKVVKKEIEKINNKFRTKTQQLKVNKGNILYLDLTLNYSHDSYVEITMYVFL